jgi:hypothetical protein
MFSGLDKLPGPDGLLAMRNFRGAKFAIFEPRFVFLTLLVFFPEHKNYFR